MASAWSALPDDKQRFLQGHGGLFSSCPETGGRDLKIYFYCILPALLSQGENRTAWLVIVKDCLCVWECLCVSFNPLIAHLLHCPYTSNGNMVVKQTWSENPLFLHFSCVLMDYYSPYHIVWITTASVLFLYRLNVLHWLCSLGLSNHGSKRTVWFIRYVLHYIVDIRPIRFKGLDRVLLLITGIDVNHGPISSVSNNRFLKGEVVLCVSLCIRCRKKAVVN